MNVLIISYLKYCHADIMKLST